MAMASKGTLGGAITKPERRIENEREQQDVDQRTRELAQQPLPSTYALSLRKGVGSVFRNPPRGLSPRQTLQSRFTRWDEH